MAGIPVICITIYKINHWIFASAINRVTYKTSLMDYQNMII